MRVPRRRGGVFAGSGGTRSVLRSVCRRFYVGKCPQGQADPGSPADEPRGAFLAECGEGSHSPPRPAASRWEFFGVAVPISLDVRLRQAVRQQLGPPPHAPGTLCRALSSRTVSRCSRGVRAVPRPVPPSVLARGHLPLGGAPFCGVASLRVRVRPSHRGQPLRGSPVARSESRAHPGVANPHVQLTAAPIRAS